MIKFIEKLLNLIYVQPCYFCKSSKEDALLCSKCYKKIHFMPEGVFKRIRNCNVYAATLYDGIIKQLIRDLKYHNKKKLAQVHAQIMFDYFKELNLRNSFLIVPVPVHKTRLKERHYNHMNIVADEFAKLTGFNVASDLLIRTKDTKKQFKLTKQERIKNIKNAFELNLNADIPQNTKIMIVDDITSTGITIEEIVKVLNKNGYNDIIALTLATPDIWN